MDNMLAWHAINPGSMVGYSDSDDHYNGGPVSLDPQYDPEQLMWTLKTNQIALSNCNSFGNFF